MITSFLTIPVNTKSDKVTITSPMKAIPQLVMCLLVIFIFTKIFEKSKVPKILAPLKMENVDGATKFIAVI